MVPVAKVFAGASNTCAILENGDARCWGNNEWGQLGLGHTEHIGDDELPASQPPISLPFVPVHMELANEVICALSEAGELVCWGRGTFGQLGYGNEEHVGDDELPSDVGLVPVGEPIEQISAASSVTCAKFVAGGVKCWGFEWDGSIGPVDDDIGDDEPASDAPYLEFSAPVAQLVTHDLGGCALLEDQRVECWGRNDDGVLGLGHTTPVEIPATTPGAGVGEPVASAHGLPSRLRAARESNEMMCWGPGGGGKLGYGFSEANIGDNELPSDWGKLKVF